MKSPNSSTEGKGQAVRGATTSHPKASGRSKAQSAASVPADLEAEQAVLGCLLATGGTAPSLNAIQPEVFFGENNRSVFAAIRDMCADSKPVGMITVTGHLRDCGLLDAVGGPAYITGLETSSAVPPSVAEYCLGRLREKAAKRELLTLAVAMTGANSGNDPESLLAQFREGLERVASTLEPASSRKIPAIVDLAGQIKNPPLTPPEVVCGILHRGSKLVLGGSSKSHKTWTLLGLGIAVATGTEWLGFPTQKGRVLYVNAEVQPPFFVSRASSICSAMAIELSPGQIDIQHLRGHCADLVELRKEIVRCIGSKDYTLIILDPIYKLMAGRDENKAGDIAALLDEVEKLAAATNAAVAFGAHYSKGNQAAKEAIDRISGSGVFARDPDAILNLTKHEEENAFIVEATLRNFPPVPPFVVRWDHPLMHRDDDLDPARLKQSRGGRAKKKPSLDEYLKLFADAWNLEPAEATLGAAELRQKFRDKGWDEKCEPALREEAFRGERLAMKTGAHNRHLIGTPKVIAAIQRHETDLENAPKKPRKTRKGRRRREKR